MSPSVQRAHAGEPVYRKITIFGVGAIGGWIGARLAAQGLPVSAIARGRTLQALRSQGLRLAEASPAGPEVQATHAINATDDPRQLGPQDLVVVAVKAPAMGAVASAMGPLLGPQTVVFTAMNGVPWWFLQGFGGALAGRTLASTDPQGAIAQAIPAHCVIGGVVHASCSQAQPGLVRHHFGNGLIVGEPAGGDTPRLRALAGLLGGAGFDLTVSPQIQRDIWYKLWGNTTINPISALTGATADRVLDDELARGFVDRVMLEAREIGARIGLPIAEMPEDRHRITRKLGAFKPSMLQDVQAGKAVEIDVLIAAVRELGQLTGVATPFTDALLGLARLHARALGLYP